MKKPKLKKYPIGGTKGFIPDTMVHYIGAGEVPYSKDQLSSMGYNYETSTGGFDEYSMGNNRRFYKTISPGTPEWNNPENPYLNAVASTQPVVKPAPKLKWPTRTDYSKGSKGPIYTNPTFAGGGEYTPIPEKDSLYIEDKLKRDPYLSSKYKYKVVEDRKKGDILYRTMPNGKDVPVNFTNMRELDRQAYKVKMDRDLMEAGQKPIYNVFAPPTFSHGGMKLPKYFNGGTESSSMIEDYRAEDGSNFWDGANGQESYYKSQEPVAPAAYGQQNNSGYKPNYNAMVGNSAMATANYANVYQDPDATTSDKAAAGRQGAAQIAGSINPMIGGIIGGVDAIAKPIKNNAEQMNSKGQLTNRNKARAGAIAGNILSPSTLATTIASGKWDLKGDKYLNEIEGDAQAQIAAEQAPMLAAAEAKRNMYYTYAQGGIHSGMPNAEIEREELMRFPNGDTHQVNGPSHESGGVPVNIPDGTQIFSDRLKDPTTKKTFAKMAEKYKIKDIDDKSTSLKKSTKELVDKIKQDKLNKIFQTQETLKQEKMNKYAQKLGYEFKQGGTKLPQYFNGGVEYVDPENLRLAQQAQSGFPAMEQVEDPSFNNALFNKYQTPFIKPSEVERLKNERSNLKQPYVPNPNDPYEQAMAAGKEFDTPTSSTGRKMNPDWIEPATNTLMQNVGNLMYLKDQGKKYDKQEFYKYSPELYNPADALRQADIEARVNRGRLKDATGGNAGALMSNLTQSQAINTLLKSKIRNDAFNQNANTLNDAQVRNIQGKYNVDDINARNKGQALTNYYNAISGVGHNTSAAYRDWKRGDVDQQTLDIISKNYPDYVYDKRRKGWFHKSTGKQLQ